MDTNCTQITFAIIMATNLASPYRFAAAVGNVPKFYKNKSEMKKKSWFRKKNHENNIQIQFKNKQAVICILYSFFLFTYSMIKIGR